MAGYNAFLKEEQAYWQTSMEEYSDCQIYGSEISSSIASAVDVYWEKELSPGNFKQKMEATQLPLRLTFLTTKENFLDLLTFQKDVESKVQEIQWVHATSTSMLLNIASHAS